MLITPNDFENINQQYLERLIKNQIQESHHLDYKREVSGNNSEIAKDISAFANSGGGNIIYGIDEKEHLPKKITPILQIDVRERIDLITKDGIDPPLNIRIHPIPVKTDEIEGYVYVLFIPKKYPRIRQVKGYKKYYKRTEFTSSPMVNSEIEQAFHSFFTLEKEKDDLVGSIEREFLNYLRRNNYLSGYSSSDGEDTHGNLILSSFLIIRPLDIRKAIFNDDILSFLTKFLFQNSNKTGELFEGTLIVRQNDYVYDSDSKRLKNILIHKDGIIIYNLRYEVPFNSREELTLKQKLDLLYLSNYYLGFFTFLYELYKNFLYFEDLTIQLKIMGISSWPLLQPPSNPRQLKLDTIKVIVNIEELSRGKLEVIKRLYEPVLNAYGRTNKDAERLYSQISKIL